MAMIGEVFAVLCMQGSIGAVTAAGAAIASLILCAAVMPFAWTYSSGKKLPKPAAALLFLLMILWGGRLFVMQWRASEAIYIPYEDHGIFGKLLVSGLIAAVCLYTSSAGLKALGRASAAAAAVGTVCLAIVAVSAFSKHEWEALAVTGNELTLRGETIRGLLMGGNAAAFAVLLGAENSGAISRTAVFFALKAAVTAAIMLTIVLVAGDIMPAADFPAVMAARLAQPFSSQRIDSLFMIVFAVYAVFSAAVQSAAAVALLDSLLPGFRRFRSAAVLSLMIASAAVMN